MGRVSLADRHVLVVDDAGSVRAFIKECLRDMGMEQFTDAGNGLRALEQLQRRPIDLIICDWDMPEMDGLELLRRLKSDETLRRVPFLMVTANAAGDKVRAAIAAGVDDYIAKPFKTPTLQHKVRRLLAR